MPKPNHRNAYVSDPAFMKRIEDQLIRTAADNPQKLPELAPTPVPAKKACPSDRPKKVALRNMESRYDRVVLDEAAGTLTCIFTNAALLGLNAMLRMHDAKGTGLKATWLKRVQALTYENKDVLNRWATIVRFPLIVEEVYVTGESMTLDSEAVCAACKPIVDSFVRCGWMPDDSTRYLAHPIPFTFRGNNPGVVITFRPALAAHGLISDSTMAAAHSIKPIPTS